MLSGEYRIVIDDGGDFDNGLIGHAKIALISASRLITHLETFAKNGAVDGEFFRGLGPQAIFLLPSRSKIDGDGEVGLLALVDTEARTVRPLRFLPKTGRPPWCDLEAWAERKLGI